MKRTAYIIRRPLQVVLTGRAYGVTVGAWWRWRPTAERFRHSGDWHVAWGPIMAWRDTTEPMTVGERGAW